jgi:hypothetical protein
MKIKTVAKVRISETPARWEVVIKRMEVRWVFQRKVLKEAVTVCLTEHQARIKVQRLKDTGFLFANF